MCNFELRFLFWAFPDNLIERLFKVFNTFGISSIGSRLTISSYTNSKESIHKNFCDGTVHRNAIPGKVKNLLMKYETMDIRNYSISFNLHLMREQADFVYDSFFETYDNSFECNFAIWSSSESFGGIDTVWVTFSTTRTSMENPIVCKYYLKLAKVFYNVFHPQFGLSSEERAIPDYEHDDDSINNIGVGIAYKKLPVFFPITLLPPSYVEFLGRERILKAPFETIEELNDGGLLLTLDDDPLDVPAVELEPFLWGGTKK